MQLFNGKAPKRNFLDDNQFSQDYLLFQIDVEFQWPWLQ